MASATVRGAGKPRMRKGRLAGRPFPNQSVGIDNDSVTDWRGQLIARRHGLPQRVGALIASLIFVEGANV